MQLNRNQFFVLLAIAAIGPFVVPKLLWIATSKQTEGVMWFTGHGNLGSALGISTYPVIRFKAGRDSLYFKGNMEMQLHKGERVSVRYQEKNPSDAKINQAVCIWGDTLAYSLLPALLILTLFFQPDIIPKRSTIVLGKKSLIRLIPAVKPTEDGVLP